MAGLGHISGGACMQIPWVRNPMKRIYPGTFSFHFRNLIYANGRNRSYLCFEVEGVPYHSSFTVSFHRGVFENQVYENKSYHAEHCFLSWFKANKLSPAEHYHVTWFLSWSPCASCAEETANFLKQHRNVTLSVFSARLYYFWIPAFQQGLRKLHCLGAQVEVMSFHDFNYCWKNFVYNRYMRFRCWKKCIKIINLCPTA
uniref:CMP/dCMP-type deaminase domain-containing protein n=1 Tax=Rhinolophus ferrumequinum TaxID=59479 RepID=A0A671DS86_RHIFE